MKKYTAIIVIREMIWVLKATGEIANPTPNQKVLTAFFDNPSFETYHVYRKVAELKSDRLTDLGVQYHDYIDNNFGKLQPEFAASNTLDVELIITHSNGKPTKDITKYNS